MKKVFSFNSELFKVTGVQKVLMDVHHAVRDDYDAKIVGTLPYKRVQKDLGIKCEEYKRLKNPFMFHNSIVILHERKFLVLFWLLNKFFFQNIKLVYIHHSVFYNHRRLSIMPKTVVAISDEGVRNLHEFFGVPNKHINKIYNCVKDIHPKAHQSYNGGEVKILYPARINAGKRQVEIVKQLRQKLNSNIKILFAGVGPESSILEETVKGYSNFQYLGFRSDIYRLLNECDYMLLFSTHEGLPITLIEAAMMGTPVICNNVGGNAEIIDNGKNGWVFEKDDWEGLIYCLNHLDTIKGNEYLSLSSHNRLMYELKFSYDTFKTNYLSLLKNL